MSVSLNHSLKSTPLFGPPFFSWNPSFNISISVNHWPLQGPPLLSHCIFLQFQWGFLKGSFHCSLLSQLRFLLTRNWVFHLEESQLWQSHHPHPHPHRPTPPPQVWIDRTLKSNHVKNVIATTYMAMVCCQFHLVCWSLVMPRWSSIK